MMNNCDRLEIEHNFTIFTGMDGHLAISAVKESRNPTAKPRTPTRARRAGLAFLGTKCQAVLTEAYPNYPIP